MVDPRTTRRVAYWALFLALTVTTTFLRLLPINPMAHGIPGPDLMLAFTFVWLMRRPDYLPAWLIIAVFLLGDMIFWRPVGLWALIVLLGTEFLRGRVPLSRALPLAAEMVMVGSVMLAMLLMNRLVLALALVDQPPLGLELLRLMMTLLAYPFVAVFSRLAFGLHRPVPGEAAGYGRRL
ncbi:MAG TPA: rod shape-determining protein MreD [Paenirhodobacter sp.]